MDGNLHFFVCLQFEEGALGVFNGIHMHPGGIFCCNIYNRLKNKNISKYIENILKNFFQMLFVVFPKKYNL